MPALLGHLKRSVADYFIFQETKALADRVPGFKKDLERHRCFHVFDAGASTSRET